MITRQPQKLVAGAVHARTAVADLVTCNAQGSTGDVLSKMIYHKCSQYLLMDPDFSIELHIVNEACGSRVGERLREAVLKALPTAVSGSAPATGVRALHALRQKPVYTLAPKAEQSLVAITTNLLGNLVEDIPPNFEGLGENKFMQEVVSRLQYYLEAKGPKKEIVRGADAMKILLPSFIEDSKKEKLDISACNPFVLYSWLIPESERAAVKAVIEQTLASCGIKKSIVKKAPAVASGSSSDLGSDTGAAFALQMFS